MAAIRHEEGPIVSGLLTGEHGVRPASVYRRASKNYGRGPECDLVQAVSSNKRGDLVGGHSP